MKRRTWSWGPSRPRLRAHTCSAPCGLAAAAARDRMRMTALGSAVGRLLRTGPARAQRRFLPVFLSLAADLPHEQLTKCQHVTFNKRRWIPWGLLCRPFLPLLVGYVWAHALASTTDPSFRKDTGTGAAHLIRERQTLGGWRARSKPRAGQTTSSQSFICLFFFSNRHRLTLCPVPCGFSPNPHQPHDGGGAIPIFQMRKLRF